MYTIELFTTELKAAQCQYSLITELLETKYGIDFMHGYTFTYVQLGAGVTVTATLQN